MILTQSSPFDPCAPAQALSVKVTPGKVKTEDRARLEQEQQAEEKRLAIMMMKRKDKYLYDKIMFGKKRKVREASPQRRRVQREYLFHLNTHRIPFVFLNGI